MFTSPHGRWKKKGQACGVLRQSGTAAVPSMSQADVVALFCLFKFD
jgi:hypothetical protein